MKFEMNDTEIQKKKDILNACEFIKQQQGIINESIEYKLILEPVSGIGWSVTLEIPEFNIKKDITDYSTF